MFTELNISPLKRACIERSDQLPGGRLGSYRRSEFAWHEAGKLRSYRILVRTEEY